MIDEKDYTFDYTDKKQQMFNFVQSMLNKSLTMFDWKNLPDTIPLKELEKQLQLNGYSIITKVKGELYAFQGGFSGLDAYGNPTEVIITNPALSFNKTLKIGSECVVIKNDDMQQGLLYLYSRYGTLIMENETTILVNNYNARMQKLISATDDSTIESANVYLENIINGKIGTIAGSKMFDSLKVEQSGSEKSIITDLIELEQYLKASLYNEIGLNANFNMKRERINSAEVSLNEDNLYPLIDNMLDNRKYFIEQVNELFNTTIEVDFSSIWKIKENEVEERTESKPTNEPELNQLDPMIQALYNKVFGSSYKPNSELDEDEKEKQTQNIKELENDEPDKPHEDEQEDDEDEKEKKEDDSL